jgi:translocation and assembly module TamB
MGAYPMTSGSQFAVDFRSRNMNEFDTVLRDLGLSRAGRAGAAALPITIGGQAEIHGTWSGSLLNPKLSGTLKASDLQLELIALDQAAAATNTAPHYVHLDAVEGVASYSDTRIAIDHAQVTRGPAHLSVSGTVDATPSRIPTFDANSMVHLKLGANALEASDVQPFLGLNLPIAGKLSAQLQADGPLHAVNGSGFVELNSGSVYGEPVRKLRLAGSIANQVLQLSTISAATPAGTASGTASYDLRARTFQADLHGAGLNVDKIEWVRQQNLKATGRLGFALQGTGTLNDPHLEADATLASLALAGEPLGTVHLAAHTANRIASYQLTSQMEGATIVAHGQTGFDNGYPTQAAINFTRLNIGTLLRLQHVDAFKAESSLAGAITLSGPLAKPEQMRGEARLQTLDATVAGVHLHGEGGLHALLGSGHIHLDPLHVTGDNTDMRLAGDVELNGTHQLDLAASGTVNLKLASTLNSDLTASGISTFQVEAHGTMEKPILAGRVDFENGALALEDMPNSLSQIQGTLLFNQNRLEVKKLTAMTGGGLLSIAGGVNFQNGLYADLTATGKGVRIRYPQGISSLADAQMHLQGSRNNLLLAGNVLITRFMVSPEMDFAALAAQTGGVSAPPAPNAPSNHLRLDIHIASSPQLSFQNAFAKLAGDVDLRVRGTLANPSVLGRISVTEGSATLAGTRYDLQRGEIAFTNPVRIEPIIDLNATAHVQDFDIALGLHGTREKMAVSYRSDPPLPEADVVALLALGRTENQQRINTQQQVQALSNPTTDALLGGALNATVSSRVQKLFGAGSVKVDPNYLGALGNSTSRIIVEEQLGRNLTLTYATNVNTTGQQLLQAEVAINRHVSVLISRDESGVFSMVLKATRRYR